MSQCFNGDEIVMRLKETLMSGILHETGWALVVDFNYILKQTCLRESALDEILRICDHKCGPIPKIKIQIIEKYVLGSECLKRGWILTGYPITVEDFKLLDMIPTPPNRILVLDVDSETCRLRLLNRRYNVVTGSEHDLISSDFSPMVMGFKLNVHPKDREEVVERDVSVIFSVNSRDLFVIITSNLAMNI
ncbi:hypothetical protein EAI_13578 [Harpegnathos saltator]|uniref:Uncharacterized protein n=1 Tax=Harpegnathos saltator TaxID=610380 RepID=E2BIW3_HARSA|nr:hypothetical protein EAI_13578 [Harpegnathos saltator]